MHEREIGGRSTNTRILLVRRHALTLSNNRAGTAVGTAVEDFTSCDGLGAVFSQPSPDNVGQFVAVVNVTRLIMSHFDQDYKTLPDLLPYSTDHPSKHHSNNKLPSPLGLVWRPLLRVA